MVEIAHQLAALLRYGDQTQSWPTFPKDMYSIRTTAQDPAIGLQPFTWTQASKSFEGALRILQRRVPQAFLPWDARQLKVHTLRVFGAKQPSCGLGRRPAMPIQLQTLDLVLQGYHRGKDFSLAWDAAQHSSVERTCYVPMLPAELAEGPYDRFYRWNRFQTANRGLARQWH